MMWTVSWSFFFIYCKSLVLYLNTCRELLWCIYFSCSHLVFLKPNFCACSVETPMNLNIHRFHQYIFNILSLCCFYVLHFKKVSTFSVFKAQWHGKRFFCCCRNDCPRMILGFYGQTLWFPNCVWSNMSFLWWCKCPDQEWFRIKQHKLFW